MNNLVLPSTGGALLISLLKAIVTELEILADSIPCEGADVTANLCGADPDSRIHR